MNIQLSKNKKYTEISFKKDEDSKLIRQVKKQGKLLREKNNKCIYIVKGNLFLNKII